MRLLRDDLLICGSAHATTFDLDFTAVITETGNQQSVIAQSIKSQEKKFEISQLFKFLSDSTM